MVIINIRSKDSIVLQPSCHHVFKPKQHTSYHKELSLVTEKQEETLMTDEYLLELGLVFWKTI